MNLVYNKEKYQYYLHKLGEVRAQPAGHEKNAQIRSQINSLLEELRDKSDIAKLNTIYSILIVPLLVVSLYLIYTSDNIYIGLIPVLLVLFYLGGVNMFMKGAIKENYNARRGQTFEEDGIAFLRSKMAYLRSALKIKVYRIRGLQYLYVIFFPIFIVSLYFAIFKEFAFKNFWTSALVAILIASLYWYFYFEKDLNRIYNIEDLTDSYKSMLDFDLESE